MPIAFRRVLSALPVLGLLAALVGGVRTAAAAPDSSVIEAKSWKQTAADRARDGSLSETYAGGRRTRTYVSPVHLAGLRFNAVAATWDAALAPGASIRLSVRAGTHRSRWSAWTTLEGEQDASVAGGSFGTLVVLAGAQAQYRLELSAPTTRRLPTIGTLSLTFIDSAQGPGPSDLARRGPGAAHAARAVQAAPRVIGRGQWGAQESLRYDASGREVWPRRYARPRKAIIHETVTLNDDPNPPATVRAIYYYHAVVRGWGDIGYNYLVDAQGNVYEGRSGGSQVVGGHARCFNEGTIGIAALGEYSGGRPSAAMVAAIENLLAWKFGEHGIDPVGRDSLGPYAPKEIPNVAMHVDLQGTCGNTHLDPGVNLRREIPPMVERLRQRLAGGYAPEPAPSPPPVEEPPGATVGEPRYTVRTAVGDGLNLREAPSDRSRVVGVVPNGSVVQEIASPIDGWVKTTYAGRTGYLWSEYLVEIPGSRDEQPATSEPELQPAETVGEPRYEVRTPLNLRDLPTDLGRILLVLAPGEVVQEITSPVDGWVKTTVRGRTGYLWHERLREIPGSRTAQAPPRDVPIVEPEGVLAPGSAALVSGTPGALNLREGPGDEHPALAKMWEGTSVRITGRPSGGWYPVEYRDASGGMSAGWAWGAFLKAGRPGAGRTAAGGAAAAGAMALPAWGLRRRKRAARP